jgi:hypothetical protein
MWTTTRQNFSHHLSLGAFAVVRAAFDFGLVLSGLALPFLLMGMLRIL